jgi:hypothetical protein
MELIQSLYLLYGFNAGYKKGAEVNKKGVFGYRYFGIKA